MRAVEGALTSTRTPPRLNRAPPTNPASVSPHPTAPTRTVPHPTTRHASVVLPDVLVTPPDCSATFPHQIVLATATKKIVVTTLKRLKIHRIALLSTHAANAHNVYQHGTRKIALSHVQQQLSPSPPTQSFYSVQFGYFLHISTTRIVILAA